MKTNLQKQLNESKVMLSEAAIVERLRRMGVNIHPQLANTPLLNEPQSATIMADFYRQYIDVAQKLSLPTVLFTPTWRANQTRVEQAGYSIDLNQKAYDFLHHIRKEYKDYQKQILIGGMMGCKGDCYLPQEGLSAQEARDFHRPQIEALTQAGCDFLFPETIPSVDEALGFAQCIQEYDIDYMIGFVINQQGVILDGTPIEEAIKYIDEQTTRPPAGYMINCAYPGFLFHVEPTETLLTRLMGYLANGSALSHAELESNPTLQMEPPEKWAEDMMKIYRKFQLKILGGCCGTSEKHLELLGDNLTV